MAERDDNEELEIERKEGDVFDGKCDFCHYETIVTRYNSLGTPNGSGGKMSKFAKDFCEVCASTTAGNMHNWPFQYDDGTKALARNISYTTNMILNAIKDNKLG